MQYYFKNSPTLLIKNLNFTSYFCQLSSFGYQIYFGKQEIISSWNYVSPTYEYLDLTNKSICLLNIRSESDQICYICQEVIFNNNEVIMK
jgi:hypothetical protein